MAVTATDHARPRRTQARGEATRRRILDATLACILERGYAQTSTVLVCERAGVPRGSLLHQFPTRAALMAAAVAQLFEQLTADYVAAFAAREADAARSPARRIAIAGELLLAAYADPRFGAALDIYAAARTDAALRAALGPVVLRHRAVITGLAHRLFPDTATSPRAARRVAVVLDALQGLAVRRIVQPDTVRDTIDGAMDVLREVLTEDPAPPPPPRRPG